MARLRTDEAIWIWCQIIGARVRPNGGGVTFVSAVAPRVWVQQVVTSFLGNFFFSDEIGVLNRSLSKALDNVDPIGYNALLRRGGGVVEFETPRVSHIKILSVDIRTVRDDT